MLHLPGFRIRVALDTNGPARSLASAGICLRPLTTNGQPPAVADATVAVDRLQTLQIGLHIPAQIPFYQDLTTIDSLDDQVDLLRAQIFRPDIGVDPRYLEDFLRVVWPHPVNVGKRGFDALVARNIDSKNSWHILGFFFWFGLNGFCL